MREILENSAKSPSFWRRRPGLCITVLAVVFATTAGARSDRVNISRMGGDIDLAEVPDGGTLKTMGGNIHVGKVHNDISITTMGGNITIDSADASLEATTMGGNIEATIVKNQSPGGHDITLKSMGGQIVLTIPKNFPMTVEVTLAYTKNNDKAYKITENLGLEESASTDWDNGHGSPRKYLYAKGRIGNGENRVTINTVNGDVIIRGERPQL
jgi:DUF4097 and DUF4098 domain-containing protein YvlB